MTRTGSALARTDAQSGANPDWRIFSSITGTEIAIDVMTEKRNPSR